MHRTILAVSALAALAPLSAQPVDNQGARDADRAFVAAQQSGDRAALASAMAPDFLFVRASGRIGNRQDFIDGFAGPGRTLDPIAVSDLLFVGAGQDTVLVGGEARVSGVEDGVRFSTRIRFTDTLVRRDGRWIVIFSQITPLPPG